MKKILIGALVILGMIAGNMIFAQEQQPQINQDALKDFQVIQSIAFLDWETASTKLIPNPNLDTCYFESGSINQPDKESSYDCVWFSHASKNITYTADIEEGYYVSTASMQFDTVKDSYEAQMFHLYKQMFNTLYGESTTVRNDAYIEVYQWEYENLYINLCKVKNTEESLEPETMGNFLVSIMVDSRINPRMDYGY